MLLLLVHVLLMLPAYAGHNALTDRLVTVQDFADIACIYNNNALPDSAGFFANAACTRRFCAFKTMKDLTDVAFIRRTSILIVNLT